MSILRQYILIVTIVITPVSLFSYSLQDELAVVKTLAIMIQRGWNDCPIVRGETVDDLPEESVALPLFQTYNDLFAYGFPTGEVGSGWSKYEKRAAFEHFIDMIPELSSNCVYSSLIPDGDVALRFCEEYGASNVLSSAKRIIAVQGSKCQSSAISIFAKFAEPSVENNAFVAKLTDRNANLRDRLRSDLLHAYIKVLMRNRDMSDQLVFSNGVSVVINSIDGMDGAIAVDKLLMQIYSSYACSSNRLAIAINALEDQRHRNIYPRGTSFYFTPITNQLLNATQPLVQLSLP